MTFITLFHESLFIDHEITISNAVHTLKLCSLFEEDKLDADVSHKDKKKGCDKAQADAATSKANYEKKKAKLEADVTAFKKDVQACKDANDPVKDKDSKDIKDIKDSKDIKEDEEFMDDDEKAAAANDKVMKNPKQCKDALRSKQKDLEKRDANLKDLLKSVQKNIKSGEGVCKRAAKWKKTKDAVKKGVDKVKGVYNKFDDQKNG